MTVIICYVSMGASTESVVRDLNKLSLAFALYPYHETFC